MSALDRPARHAPRALVLVLTAGLAAAATAQTYYAPPAVGPYGVPVAPAGVLPAYGAPLLSQAELFSLVGPVALYPDDLLALVLPAATVPAEVDAAARYLDALAYTPGLAPAAEWDDAVVALLNYPDVLRLMARDPTWTTRLGQAFRAQPTAVFDAVALFRAEAVRAGNLRSDPWQVVDLDGAYYRIRPRDPQLIYVPSYVPTAVIVRQVQPVYGYFPRPCPLYYDPAPRFGGRFFGIASAFTIGWSSQRLFIRDYDDHRHPYHGRHYDELRYRRGAHRHDDYRAYDRDHRDRWRHHADDRRDGRREVRRDERAEERREARRSERNRRDDDRGAPRGDGRGWAGNGRDNGRGDERPRQRNVPSVVAPATAVNAPQFSGIVRPRADGSPVVQAPARREWNGFQAGAPRDRDNQRDGAAAARGEQRARDVERATRRDDRQRAFATVPREPARAARPERQSRQAAREVPLLRGTAGFGEVARSFQSRADERRAARAERQERRADRR